MKSGKQGFTMVELIIVATVIGILAAIAIPNFLAARTRAKITRAKGEMEMLVIALQSYYVDRAMYPLNSKPGSPSDTDLIGLTTPVAYFTRLPKDLFKGNDIPEIARGRENSTAVWKDNGINGYSYVNYQQMEPKKPLMYSPEGGVAWFMVMSPGPDYQFNYNSSTRPPSYLGYDPTNGTTSGGDINVFGP